MLNFPIVTKVVQNGANLDVTLVLDVPAGNYRIELYQNPVGIDSTRYGEGQVFLGALSVTSTGTGAQTFTGTLTSVTATSITRISATATRDLGAGTYRSTSEFGPRAGLVVSTTADNLDGTTSSVAALILNPGADGLISLREAITAANATAGTDYIYFDITAALAGGVHTITLAYDGADAGTTPDALPIITSPVVINGWTEPDYAGTPIIELNGNNVAGAKGLELGAGSSGSTIKGLIINRFTGTGIEISGASNNHTIQGNWIGLNAAGTAASGNGIKGIYALNSTGLLIGGTTAAERNVVSGNAEQGIYFDNVDNSTISGNYVGTNAAGTGDVNGAVANTAQSGVFLTNGSSGNVIGGTSDGARNVLSGNNHFGFEVINASSQNNLLQGNYIGTDKTGLVALGNINGGAVFWGAGTGNIFGGGAAGARNVVGGNTNGGIVVGNASSGATIQGNYVGVGADGVTVLANGSAGVRIEGGSTGTLVGTNLDASNDVAERNVIAGNANYGVVIDGAATTGTLLRGNWIGLDAGGNARGNAQAGVFLSASASNNMIGGTAAGAGNTIAYNGWDGIRLSGTGTGNAFLGNSLYGNVEQAIDIGAQGVTLNDADDPDSGGNTLQNFPRLTLARTNGTNQLTLNGTLDSSANTWFRIEFFASTAQDGSGYGEGQTYLGSALVQTDGSGDATISTTLTANVAAGSFISATATQTNAGETAHTNTSEMARNVYALPLVQGALVVDTTNDVNDGDATSISTLLANKGADGFISLREAVIASNNTSGNDTLNLAAGTYTLTIAGTGEDGSLVGDIDVQTHITIAGAGMASTIISGGGIDRAIEVDGSGNLTLTDVRLTGGSVNNDGGALLIEEAVGLATLTRVDITGNTVTGGGRIGGGIHNVGTLVMTDSLVHGNSATGSDGGGISNLGTATLTRSSIYSNSARYGGGIHQLAGSMAIENLTVSGNSASSEGGGIDVAGGTLNVKFTTVAANTASGGNGGGAMVRAGALTIGSSIFADNTSTSGGRDLHGAVTSLGYNVIEHNAGFSGTVASDLVGSDPALAALALDAASGQYLHALNAGSIAIDLGGVAPPPTDQRNAVRDASADAGAYERLNNAPVLDASGTMTFASITEDDTANAGALVSTLIASAGGDRITDADGDPEGIAITATADGNGSWEYSLDGGGSWYTIGTVTNASALLLRSGDRVRFVPNAIDGTTGSITFRAWDHKVGSAGTKVSTAINGGSSAFSVATESASITVTAVNDVPSGAPVVTGTATEDQTLTANTSSIADADGLGAFAYQWQRDGSNITGATASTYLLGDADVGTNVRVIVSYTDARGTAESVVSAAVGPIANVNDAPTGSVSINDTTPTQGQTLTASNTLADADGLGTITYTWQADGSTVGTGSTYTVTEAEVGKVITVVASYTDGHGTNESITSAATAAVANVNDAPTGSVSIDDTTPAQGQTLTASNTLADADGLGTITYTWQADGSTVGTGSSYIVTEAEVGKVITVIASYADGHGTNEAVSSAATAAVANVNDAPTGSVTIDDTTPTQGQTLTASNTLADADGLGTITYTWQADGSTVGTGNTYVVTEAGVGKVITVVASYADGHGTNEAVSSAATAAVANVNDAPTGSVTIDDTTPTQSQTLTASNTLADADGLGTITYTWQADGATVGTGSTYTVTEAEVGKVITVVASYTDGHGTAEAVTSAATAAVANVNDAPTGSVTIDDTTPTQGQTLTASNTLADADGLGAITYTWQADGSTVGTGSTYTVTEAEVGKVITVVASYTDGHGTNEIDHVRGNGSRCQRQRCADRQRHDQRHTPAQGQTLTASQHAGRRRRSRRDHLHVAGRRLDRRDRQHLHRHRSRGRQGDHGGRELHRRARHGRSGDLGRDRSSRQRERPSHRLGDDQRHDTDTRPDADGEQHAGRRRWLGHDHLHVAGRRLDCRHRQHLHRHRSRGRQGDHGGRELHRWARHERIGQLRCDQRRCQHQRCADRQRDHRRHDTDTRPDADGVEHAGRCRRPGHDHLHVAGQWIDCRHRQQLHRHRGRSRQGDHGDRQLYRRARYGRGSDLGRDRSGGQRQRCADRQRHDQRHDTGTRPDADGLEHAGRRRRSGHDHLHVAGQWIDCRHRQHLHRHRGRSRQGDHGDRQLHRRPRHGRGSDLGRDRSGGQRQRCADRLGEHRRHHADPRPDADGEQHAGRRRRSRRDHLHVAGRRLDRRRPAAPTSSPKPKSARSSRWSRATPTGTAPPKR